MAKMYKKSKLQYRDGLVVKDGKVIGIDNEIVVALNRIEREYQKALWNKEHPIRPAALVEEFAFETERGNVYPHIEVRTPHLDDAIDKAIGIMDDLDAVSFAERVNKYLEEIHPLVEWVAGKRIVSCSQPVQARFDLKYIGNPLELDKNQLVEIVTAVCE